MKTFPGLHIGVFKDPEEREQIKIIDDQMRQFSAALAKSIFPGQLPAANPTPDPGAPGGGTTLPPPAKGDLLFSPTAGVWSRLTVGANTALLTSSNGLPVWSTAPPLLLNYLYLPGRLGGQTLTLLDTNPFTINGPSVGTIQQWRYGATTALTVRSASPQVEVGGDFKVSGAATLMAPSTSVVPLTVQGFATSIQNIASFGYGSPMTNPNVYVGYNGGLTSLPQGTTPALTIRRSTGGSSDIFWSLAVGVTAASTFTTASTTVTSAGLFGSVSVGHAVVGPGIDEGTTVTAKASNSSITISKNPIANGTGVTLRFSTITVRIDGSGRLVASSTLQTGLTTQGSISAAFGTVGTAAISTIQTNTTGWLGSQPSGLWLLRPTLSDPGSVGGPGVPNTVMLFVDANVSDAAAAQVGIRSDVVVSDDSGTGGGGGIAQALEFNAESEGTGDIASLIGAAGITLHASSGLCSGMVGLNGIVRANTGAGTVAAAIGMKSDCLTNANITEFTSSYIGMPTVMGGATVAEATGLRIEYKGSGITQGWAIISGSGDLGFDSKHAGRIFIGRADTTPEYTLDVGGPTGAEVRADMYIGRYAPGSVTILTEHYTWAVDHLSFSGSEVLTLEGTAVLGMI